MALALALAVSGAGWPVNAAGPDFADWHLPVPAGEWAISRGPCGSAAVFDHDCQYYENQCAVDLVPVAGSMENVPVLAPQAGRVLFAGVRSETGLMLMLLHGDGRVSGYMHLSRLVVSLDEAVGQGQVVGYAGKSGTTRPHLHFFVQPNAVERSCQMIMGLDVLDYRNGRAVSRNLAWAQLTLAEPPSALPDWLPALDGAAEPALQTPERLLLSPGTAASVPVLARGRYTAEDTLRFGATTLTPARRTPGYALFKVPVIAPVRAGEYEAQLEITTAARTLRQALRYTVRPAATAQAGGPVLLESVALVRPGGWTSHAASPELCWRVPLGRDRQDLRLRYRVIVSGPAQADSGWVAATCWRPPALPPGTYFWKVFLRDPAEAMNRPNQRPFAFIVR